ncbi:MAG: hypothetical protein ACYTXY_42910, partial [Nostoc sp.]
PRFRICKTEMLPETTRRILFTTVENNNNSKFKLVRAARCPELAVPLPYGTLRERGSKLRAASGREGG